MKQVLGGLLGLYLLCCLGVISHADFNVGAYSEKFYSGWDDTTKGADTIDRGTRFKKQADGSGIRDKFLKFLGIDNLKAEGAIGFIKGILNVILAFAGLIALCFIIYGFLRVFFSSGDEAIKNAWTIVRISAIALAIIATAWFLESAFFYVYEKISGAL